MGESSGQASSRRPPAQYNVFGLVAESDIDLPLMLAGSSKQVEICAGSVDVRGIALYESAEPELFGCYRNDDEIFLVWDEARFSVTRDRIVVDATDEESALQLLVPAVWSVVLAAHQRESLHGSAITRLGGGVAVLGPSGSGKSTAARRMIERGWQLVSDDLLTFDANLRVVPGPPWMRLLPGKEFKSQSIFDRGGKWRMHSPTACNPVPLSAMVIMDSRYEHLVRLTGTSAVAALFQQIYNPVLTHDGQAKRRFDLVHALTELVPIYAVPPRSLSPDQIEDIVGGDLS